MPPSKLILAALCCSVVAIGDDRPNIIFILADDVGCEPIGAYGGTRWKTPNIDALAAAGMRFDHCYSMPVCHPSRTTLLTGRYPFRLNSKWGSFPRELESQTLPARLKAAGYRTAVAGKWQLCLMKDDKQQPARMGFDEWSVFGWHEGARFHEPFIYQNGRLRTDTKGKYGPDLYVEFLSDFIERSQEDEKPFFAFYSMALAHDVTDDIPVQVPYVPGSDRWMNYGEMITSMDQMVGRLLARLDELQLRRNTLILFTGDNGTAVRSKLRHITGRKYEYEKVYSVVDNERVPGGKGTLLDIGTHVPLIASWQGKIKPGSRSSALVDFSDFLPTLGQLASADVPLPIDGNSFVGALEANDFRQRTFAFSERKDGRAWVRTQRYKLYRSGKFFDVQSDPRERSPLSSAERKQIAEFAALRRSLEGLKIPNRK